MAYELYNVMTTLFEVLNKYIFKIIGSTAMFEVFDDIFNETIVSIFENSFYTAGRLFIEFL